jgi:superfamily I DNA/RNA helicase
MISVTEHRNYRSRLLYVAMTRAQGILVGTDSYSSHDIAADHSVLFEQYLTHAQQRMLAGDEMERELSPFVRSVQQATPVGHTR